MEANEIKEAMAFFAIIFNRGDGFWARRWKFFELINNRGDTIIRSHRVPHCLHYLGTATFSRQSNFSSFKFPSNELPLSLRRSLSKN